MMGPVGPKKGIWAIDLEVLVPVLVVMMMMVEQSLELKLSHPMHEVVDRVNEIGGPYFGLVMAYPTEERALQESGFFVPNSDIPRLELAGRRFNIGKIGSVNVIYVMTGEQMEFKSGKGQLTELNFGAFNWPEKGENLLSKIEFTPTQLYTVGNSMKEIFWLPIDHMWFNVASQLRDLHLEQCINETFCLSKTPEVVYGLKGSTADIYLDNAAYREFLFTELGVSVVDEESAAVVMTCLSNGVRCIVFRGISDLAGGGTKLRDTSLSSLASVNALSVAVKFLELIGEKYAAQDH